MPGMTLPPGFRFHPTDEELVAYYLKKRVKGSAIEFDVIADVDLYKCEPWDLPPKSRLPSNDLEWFFFSPRDRKYPNGSRTNRATEAGYWKATGRDRFVKTGAKTIGMKKTLVFYTGRAPHGERTDWLMHEYRLDGEEWEATNVSQDAYVLCRVFKKNGLAPVKTSSGSLDEGIDNADSPADEKNSVFWENDVKPSLDLPPQPPLHGQALGQVPEAVPVKQQQVEDFSSEELPSDFVLDDAVFGKMDTSFWDVPWLENADNNNDVAMGAFPTFDTKNEFKNSWQEQVGGDMARVDNPWSGMSNMLPMNAENDFLAGLDFMPPLVTHESPSPPTLPPPSPSIYEPDTFFDSTPQQQTIRILPRLPAAALATANMTYMPGPGRAKQSIKFEKRRVPRPRVEQRGVTETGISETVVPAETKSIFEKAAPKPSHSEEVDSEARTAVSGKKDNEEDAESNSGVVATIVPPTSAKVSPPALNASNGSDSDEESRQSNSWATTIIMSPLSDMPVFEKSENINSLPSMHLTAESEPLLKQPQEDELGEKVDTISDSLATPEDTHVDGSVDHPSELSEPGDSSMMKPFLTDLKSSMSGLERLSRSLHFQQASASDYSSSDPKYSKLKGSIEFPSGIGSIHVNAVTISCSCNKVSSQPHVQAIVCDCYSSSKMVYSHVLPGSWEKTREQGLEEGKGLERRRGLKKGFACVFFMGTLSACFGFFLFHGIWRATCQIVRSGVQIVTAASDL